MAIINIMDEKRSEEHFTFVSAKRREKSVSKYFIGLMMPLEQNVTCFTFPPSNGGENRKDREKKKYLVVFYEMKENVGWFNCHLLQNLQT